MIAWKNTNSERLNFQIYLNDFRLSVNSLLIILDGEAADILAEADKDGDGRVTFDGAYIRSIIKDCNEEGINDFKMIIALWIHQNSYITMVIRNVRFLFQNFRKWLLSVQNPQFPSSTRHIRQRDRNRQWSWLKYSSRDTTMIVPFYKLSPNKWYSRCVLYKLTALPVTPKYWI